MKYFKILTILLFTSLITLSSCKDDAKKTATEVPKAVVPPSAAIPSSEPAQNANGVWHYTCLKGCAGGAGKPMACATCGNTLAHNQAYHANANNTLSTSPFANTPVGAQNTPRTEPAQNANGVWHYICSTGCAGGSGKAIACATCGNPLAHNAAYHQ